MKGNGLGMMRGNVMGMRTKNMENGEGVEIP
jgi:hypothetical protein